MKISVIGVGYVGLVSAACFADMGNTVWCVDCNEKRVKQLKKGILDIYEPELAAMVTRNVQAGRLKFTTRLKEAVKHARVHFIAVGTPEKEDGSADLQQVFAVADALFQLIHKGQHVIVNKSTVPVGTADALEARLNACDEAVIKRVHIASNPEFLKEGSAVADFMRPSRIIIGCKTEKAEKVLTELYRPFTRNHARTLLMQPKDAEMTKYAANAMLATKISFMNEMANLCDALNVDVEHVRQGIGADERIGYHFIYPGCGYGGSCFPKDVKALIHTATQVDSRAPILQAVEACNQAQKQILFSKIARYFDTTLKGKTFAVWGLAFKPQTDDMRAAPSLELIQQLLHAGAIVQAFDPIAQPKAAEAFAALGMTSKQLILANSAEDAIRHADALCVVTEWREFRSPDFAWLAHQLKHKVIFDGRNVYEPEQVARFGLDYVGIGRRHAAAGV